MLGRRVTRGPDHLTHARDAGIVFELGHPSESEVGHPDAVLPVEQDVRGLDVPVDDPVAPRLVESIHGLDQDSQRLIRSQSSSATQPVGQALATDVLHDQVQLITRVAERVHVHDVRVLDGRHHPCLASEPVDHASVRRQSIRDDLDRHRAAEGGLGRQIDLTHPSSAQQANHLESRDLDRRGSGAGRAVGAVGCAFR